METDPPDAPDSLPVDAPPAEALPAEALATDSPPVDALPADAPPTDSPPAEAVPAEAVPAEALPAEALPAEALPADALPADALPVDALPAEALPVPRWGLGDVILGLAVGVVLSSVFAGIWLGLSGDDQLSIGGQAFSQMGLWIGLVGSVVLATRRKGSGSLTTDFGWAFRWVDLLIGTAAAAVAMLVIVPGVAFLLGPLLGDPEVSQPVKDLVDKAQGPSMVGLVLVAAVGAPLVEELFFRGLLLRAIQKRLGAGLAIAGSSVLFGLAHPNDLPLEGQLMVMAALAALAVALAAIAVKTGRLGASIVAHAVFNAVNLAVAFNA